LASTRASVEFARVREGLCGPASRRRFGSLLRVGLLRSGVAVRIDPPGGVPARLLAGRSKAARPLRWWTARLAWPSTNADQPTAQRCWSRLPIRSGLHSASPSSQTPRSSRWVVGQ